MASLSLAILLLLLAATEPLARADYAHDQRDDPWYCSSISAQRKPGLQRGPVSPIVEKWLCRNPRTGEKILKSEETLLALDYPQRRSPRQPRQSPGYSQEESQTDLPEQQTGGLPNDGKGTIRIRPGRK